MTISDRIQQEIENYFSKFGKYPTTIKLSPENYAKLEKECLGKYSGNNWGQLNALLRMGWRLRWRYAFGKDAAVELGTSMLGDRIIYIGENESGVEMAQRYLKERDYYGDGLK